MEKKRILYLGNKLSHRGGNPTGIETLAPKLRSLGHHVVAVSSVSNKVLRLLSMLFNIVWRSRKTDVVLIDTYSTQNFWYAYLGAKVTLFLKVPYCCVLRGGDLPSRLKKSADKCQFLFNNAKTNVALSNYLFEAFQQAGYQNLTYIPNFIEVKNYSFLKRETVQPKLLWVRRIAEIYNPIMALGVLKALTEKYPEAKLIMMGPQQDKGLFAKCKEFAEQYKLQVEFTGKLEKAEWTRRSKECDIFINTTNFDNTPISVIEAMALGLPVVSTNVGGIPFLIDDGKDGLLSAPENSIKFARKIEELIENPSKAQEVSKAGRRKAESFDWHVVKEDWNAILS